VEVHDIVAGYKVLVEPSLAVVVVVAVVEIEGALKTIDRYLEVVGLQRLAVHKDRNICEVVVDHFVVTVEERAEIVEESLT
jgi:hypothetical protein